MIGYFFSQPAMSNFYIMRSNALYKRFEEKSEDCIERYRRILNPRSILDRVGLLFDGQRSLKLNVLDEAILSKKTKKRREEVFKEKK